MVNIRMDLRLKRALEKLAEMGHKSVSDVIREAVIKELEKVGISWLDEPEEEDIRTPNI